MAIFCTNCGNKLDDDAAFCTKCGAKVGTVISNTGGQGIFDKVKEDLNNDSTFNKFKEDLNNDSRFVRVKDEINNDITVNKIKDNREKKKAKKILKSIAGGFTLKKEFRARTASFGLTSNEAISLRTQVEKEINAGNISSEDVENRVNQLIIEYKNKKEEINQNVEFAMEYFESEEIQTKLENYEFDNIKISSIKNDIIKEISKNKNDMIIPTETKDYDEEGIKKFINEKIDYAHTSLEESKRKGTAKGEIPRLSGIAEYREDSIVIKKTGEVIPIAEISNFSLHQSSQSLWSDVKVDFDYNGFHYRTQVSGKEKGKLQTIEKKINAIEMSKFTNAINNANSNNSDSGKSKVEKLRELKELLDDGIIDEEEFKELKAEIIKE